MARIYATEEGTGRRFLLRLECDGPGCSESIKPHPEIAESGWMKRSQLVGSQVLAWDYCPSHAHLADSTYERVRVP